MIIQCAKMQSINIPLCLALPPPASGSISEALTEQKCALLTQVAAVELKEQKIEHFK